MNEIAKMSTNRMTNKLFILGLAVVSVLSSCTSDDILAQDDFESEVMDSTNVVVKSSDYEIRLSNNGGSNSMRAILESDENNLFSTVDLEGNMGIFCLSYKTMSSSAPTLNWNHSNTNTKKYNAWLSNVEANARIEDVEIEGEPTKITRIRWSNNGAIDEAKKYYYPMGGWYQYALYGYYPRVDDNQITWTSNSAVTRMTIDGTQDVIWGKTEITDAQEGDYAYSARYFYTKDGLHAGEIPNLEMKHVLTRLRFKVIAGARYSETETVEQQGIKILDVSVVDVEENINLTIAQRGAGATEGAVVPTGSSKTDFYLHNANGDVSCKYESPTGESRTSHLVSGLDDNRYSILDSHNEENPLYLGAVLDEEGANPTGDGILLPPKGAYTTAGTYSIRVTMTDKTGEIFEHVEPIALEKPEEGFLAGKAYWVQIKVNARKEITLQATLAPWEESGNNAYLEF